MECHEIRRKFITYYQQNHFQFLPSAPLLHPSVPMSFEKALISFIQLQKYTTL